MDRQRAFPGIGLAARAGVSAFSGYVAVRADRAVYFGNAGRGDLHAIHTLKIAIALESYLRVRFGEDGAWQRATSLIIPAEQPHVNGDGKSDELFYYRGDGNWWMGLSDGSNINWHLAGNTKGFGDLLDGTKKFFTGDFNGDGKTDVMFYFNGDSNWWMGLSDGSNVNWHLAGNTKLFVTPTSDAFRFYTGDFNGDGKVDVLSYYSGDSNWWMGLSDGSGVNWHLAGNTAGFGNLIDFTKWFFTGDFDGNGTTDVMFYYKGDSNWWMGLSDGSSVGWHLAGNTAGFGNLLDGTKKLFSGDFNGDHKADVAFYFNGDSNWWMGLSDGNSVGWHLAGNTTGFGNLLR